VELDNDFINRALSHLAFSALVIGVVWAGTLRADDWPQWRGPRRDGAWRENGILETFPADGLKIRWKVPVGRGWSSPVVAQGRVFVTDCDLGPEEQHRAKERIHCFDEATGAILWTCSYQVDYPEIAWTPGASGYIPTSTPIVDGGKVYAWGCVGQLLCLDAVKGEILWKKDYPHTNVPFTCSPLIEGKLLILFQQFQKSNVLAIDKESGEEVWRVTGELGHTNSSPIVIEAGGKRQVICSSAAVVISCDPQTGEVFWRERIAGASGNGVPTPVFHDNYLLIGGVMVLVDIHQPAISILWPLRKLDALGNLSSTSTPLFHGDKVLLQDGQGLLACREVPRSAHGPATVDHGQGNSPRPGRDEYSPDPQRGCPVHLHQSGRIDPGPTRCPKLPGGRPRRSDQTHDSFGFPSTNTNGRVASSRIRQPVCFCPQRRGVDLRLSGCRAMSRSDETLDRLTAG